MKSRIIYVRLREDEVAMFDAARKVRRQNRSEYIRSRLGLNIGDGPRTKDRQRPRKGSK